MQSCIEKDGGKLLGVEAAEAGPGDGPRGADSLLDSSALDWALIDTIARKLGGTVVVTWALKKKHEVISFPK